MSIYSKMFLTFQCQSCFTQ